MLRLNVLVLLFSGVLVSCGPTHPQKPASSSVESPGQKSRALNPIPTSYTVNALWSGNPNNCLSCSGRTTTNTTGYACSDDTSPAAGTLGWNNGLASFTNPVPSGYVVVKVSARVIGQAFSLSQNAQSRAVPVSMVRAGTNTYSVIGTYSTTPNAICPQQSCVAETVVESQEYTDGFPGYDYTGTNTNNNIKLDFPATSGNKYCVSHAEVTLFVKQRLLSIPASPLEFGHWKKNTPVEKKVTVAATGGADVTLTPSITQGGGVFAVKDEQGNDLNNVTFNLTPSQPSRTLVMTFTPQTVELVRGNLRITSNSVNNPSADIALEGTGLSYATDVTIDTGSDFGEQAVNTISPSRLVTVRNAGKDDLQVNGIDLALPFRYIFHPQDPVRTTPSFPLLKGESARLLVTFEPSTLDLGRISRDLIVRTGESGNASTTVALSGIGVNPSLVVNPDSWSFSEQVVGAAISATKTVTLSNPGTGTLTVNIPPNVTGSPFSLDKTGTKTLRNGDPAIPSSLALTVTFNPTARGPVGTDITFTNESGVSIGTLRLSGKGVTELVMVDRSDKLDFGMVPVGIATAPKLRVTLKNNSTLPINLSDVELSAVDGGDLPFSVGAVQPGMTIGSKGSAYFDVTFTPIKGAFPGSLVVRSDADRNPSVLPVLGEGTVALAEFRSDQDKYAGSTELLKFGGVRVSKNAQIVVRLFNRGKSALSFSNPTISPKPGTPTGVFFYNGDTTARTIAYNQYYEFPVSFSPQTKDGSYFATLTIQSNAENGSSGLISLALEGAGAYSQMSVSPKRLDFGDTPVSTSSQKKSITVTNVGNASVMMEQPTVQGPFTIFHVDGGTLAESVEVKKGSNFTFNVAFNPSTKGPVDGGVQLTDPSGEVSEVSIPLSGNGTVAELKISSPGTFTFNNQRVNETSGVQALTIRNEGQAPLVISQLFSSNSAFEVESPIVSPDAGLILSPSGGEVVKVTFTPTALGATSGTLFIIANSAVAFENPTMWGTGVAGQITVEPDIVNFGQVEVSSTGTAQQGVKIINIGKSALTITNVLQPSDSAFSVSGLPTGDGGLTLAPDGSWPFTVSFKPRQRGSVLTSTVIQSDSFTLPSFPLSLTGTGVAAAVQLVPEDVLFGKSNVGTATVRNVGISNVGEKTLYVSNVAFVDEEGRDGGTGGDFKTEMKFPQGVDAGATLTVPLEFTPRLVGARQAQALIYSNFQTADGGPVVARLWGEGTTPHLDVTPARVDFEEVMVDTPSTEKFLKITNTGNGKLTLTKMELGGPDRDRFSMSGIGQSVELPPSNSTGDAGFIEIPLTFTPNAERPFSGLVLIESNDLSVPSVSIPLSGLGVRQQIQLETPSLDFGKQLIGTDRTLPVIISNKSDKAVTLDSLSPMLSGFRLKEPLPLPYTLQARKSLRLEVTFTPQSQGEVSSPLKIIFSNPQQTFDVLLRGQGLSSVLSVSSSLVDFGTVRIGVHGEGKPLIIKNESSQPITLGKPTLLPTGENFSLDAINSIEGMLLGAGEILPMKVFYAPREEALSKGTLSFSSTIPSQPNAVSVELKGRATMLLLSVEPGSLDFGRVDVNKSVEPKVVTVTNKSAEPKLVKVELGTAGSPFMLDTKALVEPLASGQSATFSVAFDPENAGAVENEVQVSIKNGSSNNEVEARIPVKGQGRAITGQGGGCSTGSTQAGGVGLLALLALVGLRSRRRHG